MARRTNIKVPPAAPAAAPPPRPLELLTAALADLKSPGDFAVAIPVASDDLHLDVKGVGALTYPIPAAVAEQLCAVGRPAAFGRGDKTLLDSKVRNTWEIPKSRIKLDARAWKPTLTAQLTVLKASLGIPENVEIEATFDKMLVYGPGQFFAPHQDSERADNMWGSLVVVLPTDCSGGALVVEHNGEKKTLQRRKDSKNNLLFAGFYADCQHEVRPVVAGHRVVLTYHLSYKQDLPAPKPPASLSVAVNRVAQCLESYFTTSRPVSSYSVEPQAPPDRLIYLLDHEYTEKSLGWTHLKNADRVRVTALLEAADRLDCEVFLALTEVYEHWSCYGDDDWGRGYRRRGWERYGQYRDRDEDKNVELGELLECSVELRHWLPRDSADKTKAAAQLHDSELCFTRPSQEMDPFKSEHEGYMGNYGNTMDRWYHRAALVLWPRERNFVIQAKLSPSWAIDQIALRIKTGALEQAQKDARSLLPFWKPSAPREAGAAFFSALLSTASALADQAIANELLSPFPRARFTANSIRPFVGLVQQYGHMWARKVLAAWKERDWSSHHHTIDPWLHVYPRICKALSACESSDCKVLAAWILSNEIDVLRGQCARDFAGDSPSSQTILLEELRSGFVAAIEGAAVIASPTSAATIITLATRTSALPVMILAEVLEQCREKMSAKAAATVWGLGPLYQHVTDRLRAAIALPARRADDWSMEPATRCHCGYCRKLADFLQDPRAVELTWPLAERDRQHVADTIAERQLPVSHATVRKGSPYSLVLSKQSALFENEKKLRASQEAMLKLLTKHQRAFGSVAVAR